MSPTGCGAAWMASAWAGFRLPAVWAVSNRVDSSGFAITAFAMASAVAMAAAVVESH